MKQVKQLINVGDGKLLNIEIKDHEEYYMMALGEYNESGDLTYTEEVVGKDDLKKLRDAIDFMIQD